MKKTTAPLLLAGLLLMLAGCNKPEVERARDDAAAAADKAAEAVQETGQAAANATQDAADRAAEVSGEVVKIYVENGQPVEYGQPLFGIKK